MVLLSHRPVKFFALKITFFSEKNVPDVHFDCYYYEYVTEAPYCCHTRTFLHWDNLCKRKTVVLAVRGRRISWQAHPHLAERRRRLQEPLFQGHGWRHVLWHGRLLGRIPRRILLGIFPRFAVHALPRNRVRLRFCKGAQRNLQGHEQSEQHHIRAFVQLQGSAGHFDGNAREHLRLFHIHCRSGTWIHEARRA